MSNTKRINPLSQRINLVKAAVTSAVLFLSTSYASTTLDYLNAKAELDKGADISAFDSLKSNPLYPYAASEFYANNLNRDAEILALLETEFSAPPVKKLAIDWWQEKYTLGQYQQVVDSYFDVSSVTANCLYRASLLALGRGDEALADIESVWLSASSVSNYCDPVFAAWGKANDANLIMRRALMAYSANNLSFALTLANKLPAYEASIFNEFVGYNRNPTELLSQSAAELTSNELKKRLLPNVLSKLVRKDSVQYTDFAIQFNTVLDTNPDYQAMLKQLNGYLANRGSSKITQVYPLILIADDDDNEAFLRYLVGSQQWQTIIKQFANTDNPSLELNYWLARAYEKSGKAELANKHYQNIANTRSYYGFLAADKLGLEYDFNYQPIGANAKNQANFANNKSLIRAQALYSIGDALSARRELFAILPLMDTATAEQLAYWLSQRNLNFEAIYTLGRVKSWNDIQIRFPRPYDNYVSNAAAANGIPATWIYAIIRQESTMNPRAVSSANAKGLMQLIPGTARAMAKQTGASLSNDGIFQAGTNITLGSAYLANLYSEFGNIALASAGYNAGPHRVNRWTENGIPDMDVWVETIPFNETRKYVKRILEYQAVYAHLTGQPIVRVSEILNQ